MLLEVSLADSFCVQFLLLGALPTSSVDTLYWRVEICPPVIAAVHVSSLVNFVCFYPLVLIADGSKL
jgi:hypothetical protein